MNEFREYSVGLVWTKWTSSSHHQNVTCPRHDMAENYRASLKQSLTQ